ncbi:MAG: hypothetical protein WC480_03540 [Patescibacteria group bacterium]
MFYLDKKNDGNILIVSLLVVSTLVLTVTFLSQFIVQALRQSRYIDEALPAWYIAESGLENGLYQIRQEDDFTNLELDLTFPDNLGRLLRTYSDQEENITLDLRQNEYYQLDLYSLEEEEDDPPSIKTIRLWADSQDCPLLVGWADWQNQESWGDTYQEVYLPAGTLNNGADGYKIELITGPAPQDSEFIRAKFKAVSLGVNECSVSNLVVRAYTDLAGQEQVNIPSRILLDSQGFYRSSRQKILVTMPRQLPDLDIFDYILFSETSIISQG